MSFMARLRALERDTPASVGVTPGTAAGNSSLVLNSSKDASGIGNLSGTKWTGLVVGNSTGTHTGNVSGTTGNFTGNVSAGNIACSGAAAVTGNLSGGNITSGGACAITGNLSGGNISSAGACAITGNLSGGNIATAGNSSVGGTLGVTGLATLTLMPRLAESNINAAGTVVGNATQIVAGFVTVAQADGTKGVVLPATPATGTWVAVKNNAGSALKVYPDAAATINAIGSNGPISMAANTSAIFFADSTTQWWTIPLLPS